MNELSMLSHVIVQAEHTQHLLDALSHRGYRVIGPTVLDRAIVYDEITSVDDLPRGWTDEQTGGTYRLARRSDNALFGYTVGPHAWKRFLQPPQQRLWQARLDNGALQIIPETEAAPRFAFIGVRACDLRAIGVQDRVFTHAAHTDPAYTQRRQAAFVVAVNCGQAGGTCFCVSMQTGPRVTDAFDLALTEILDESRHVLVVEVGSERGRDVIQDVPHAAAETDDIAAVDDIVAATARQMGRTLDTTDIKDLLYDNLEHPRWDEVASRCLSCANCTMVCPTCFCNTVEDVTSITGDHAERWRKWDSCFTLDFSYIHGGSLRPSTRSRYRQWLTHKLATWIDQFGTSGCVGCGRCITWCPVGIDITEEVRAIRREGGA